MFNKKTPFLSYRHTGEKAEGKQSQSLHDLCKEKPGTLQKPGKGKTREKSEKKDHEALKKENCELTKEIEGLQREKNEFLKEKNAFLTEKKFFFFEKSQYIKEIESLKEVNNNLKEQITGNNSLITCLRQEKEAKLLEIQAKSKENAGLSSQINGFFLDFNDLFKKNGKKETFAEIIDLLTDFKEEMKELKGNLEGAYERLREFEEKIKEKNLENQLQSMYFKDLEEKIRDKDKNLTMLEQENSVFREKMKAKTEKTYDETLKAMENVKDKEKNLENKENLEKKAVFETKNAAEVLKQEKKVLENLLSEAKSRIKQLEIELEVRDEGHFKKKEALIDDLNDLKRQLERKNSEIDSLKELERNLRAQIADFEVNFSRKEAEISKFKAEKQKIFDIQSEIQILTEKNKVLETLKQDFTQKLEENELKTAIILEKKEKNTEKIKDLEKQLGSFKISNIENSVLLGWLSENLDILTSKIGSYRSEKPKYQSELQIKLKLSKLDREIDWLFEKFNQASSHYENLLMENSALVENLHISEANCEKYRLKAEKTQILAGENKLKFELKEQDYLEIEKKLEAALENQRKLNEKVGEISSERENKKKNVQNLSLKLEELTLKNTEKTSEIVILKENQAKIEEKNSKLSSENLQFTNFLTKLSSLIPAGSNQSSPEDLLPVIKDFLAEYQSKKAEIANLNRKLTLLEFTKKEAILSLKINHEDMNRSFREISQGVRPKRGNINGFFEKQANLEQKKERYDCFREEKT